METIRPAQKVIFLYIIFFNIFICHNYFVVIVVIIYIFHSFFCLFYLFYLLTLIYSKINRPTSKNYYQKEKQPIPQWGNLSQQFGFEKTGQLPVPKPSRLIFWVKYRGMQTQLTVVMTVANMSKKLVHRRRNKNIEDIKYYDCLNHYF